MTLAARVGFAMLAGLTALGVVVGVQLAEPLPASVSPFWLVPPLLVGIYLAVAATWIRDQGLYGALFARLPDLAHLLPATLGFGVVGACLIAFAKLPPAEILAAEREGLGLASACSGPRDVRVERGLLPALERAHALRPSLRGSPRDALDVRLRAVGERCLPLVRDALTDPDGAHASWRLLRDALAAHPELRPGSADDPVWTAPWREARSLPDVVPPVQVDLGLEIEQPVLVE